MHERQLRQAPGDSYMLARGPRQQCATPSQPLRARAASRLGPASAPVELANELEPPTRPGVDVRGKRRNLVLKLLDAQVVEIKHVACCHCSQHDERLATGPDVLDQRSSGQWIPPR